MKRKLKNIIATPREGWTVMSRRKLLQMNIWIRLEIRINKNLHKTWKYKKRGIGNLCNYLHMYVYVHCQDGGLHLRARKLLNPYEIMAA